MLRVNERFSSDLEQLPAIRASVGDAIGHVWALRPDESSACLLELAVTEAAANIIRHAYEGMAGRPIEMQIEADADQACVSLIHEGKSFDPEAVDPPAFDGSRSGGFGVYLIAQSVDDVTYGRDERGRNVIRLFKRCGNHSAKDSKMNLPVETFGDVAVVTITVDHLDASNSASFKSAMQPIQAAHPKVVLDFKNVHFVDSSGCGMIIQCLKRSTEAGGDLRLCQVPRPVRTVFDLIRLHRICDILDSSEAAVASFAAAPR